MNNLVSRRNFLKGSAAVALAAAFAGCSGGGDTSVSSTQVTLGSYTIDVVAKDCGVGGWSTAGQDANTGTAIAKFKIKADTGVGVSLALTAFSATTSDGVKLQLKDLTKTVQFVQGVEVPAEIEFTTRDKTVYEKLASGATSLKVTVKFGGKQNAIYTINLGTKAATVQVVDA